MLIYNSPSEKKQPGYGLPFFPKGLIASARQLHRIVIRSHTVGTDLAAFYTAVYDCPFSVFSDPDSDRLHASMTFRFPVSRFIVQMDTVKAVRAVISVICPGACRNDRPAADFTCERVGAWVSPVIFLIEFSFFIFSVHLYISFLCASAHELCHFLDTFDRERGEEIGFDAIDNILIRLSCSAAGVVLISPQKRHLCMISHSFSDLTQIPTVPIFLRIHFLPRPHCGCCKGSWDSDPEASLLSGCGMSIRSSDIDIFLLFSLSLS